MLVVAAANLAIIAVCSVIDAGRACAWRAGA
jgi:hypothetical protein